MTTTRELCDGLSVVLQVPGVERYAARLVRGGLLPRAGEKVDERDVAVLLLAVAAAPDPSQASHVIEALLGLRLQSLRREFVGGMVVLGSVADQICMPATVIDTVEETLEADISSTAPGFQIVALAVEQGGLHVSFSAFVTEPSEVRAYHAAYGLINLPIVGLRTYVEIPGLVFRAVAEALNPQTERRRQQEPQMRSLLMH